MAVPILSEQIERTILLIRGQPVMLDTDLAALYGVPAKTLNQAVRRNVSRFPADFMFQLTEREATALRSQFVTLKTGRGQHRKYRPYAFTEQGIAMLSSVLHSERAIQVNIAVMRTFVQLREMIGSGRNNGVILHISERGGGVQSGCHRRSGDPSRRGQRPLFMGVRDETVETPSETGAWSPERPRRTRSSTSRSGGASPPASMWLVGMLACRSCVSAVAVEALMDNVREEGKLELTEGARA
jgi:hypothetical protein